MRIIYTVILLISFVARGQNYWEPVPHPRPLEISVKKTGPYFGYERGRFDVFEIGAERMWKKIKLVKPKTHGAHLGFNYNFFEHVLGFETGYWQKEGRLNLTYGGSLVLRTNFEKERFGVSPMLGYRVFGLHLQAGYHILTKSSTFTNTNNFFIRLRFTFVNDRDWDVDGLNFGKRKKKKKN